MATLATFFKRSDFLSRTTAARVAACAPAIAVRADKHAHVRAQADPYALRALPNDDIYFYSKRIDNSRVVRQADPGARGECWSAVGAAGVLLMLGASIIAPHVASVLSGYKLESLKQERQGLLNQRRELDVREAALLSPERLNELAKARNLTDPSSDQVVHLDVSSDRPIDARNQVPAAAPATVHIQ